MYGVDKATENKNRGGKEYQADYKGYTDFMEQEKFFKLKGRTFIVIDWANVYGWFEHLRWKISPEKMYRYLRSYEEIEKINFYFGIELQNQKSVDFQKEIKEIGYTLVSKEVKWVPVSLDKSHFKKRVKELTELFDRINGQNQNFEKLQDLVARPVLRRKCDFDVEITMDIMRAKDTFDSIILFSGDGDYKAACEYLLDNKKQVIVIHPFGVRGKEYNELLKRQGNRPYLCAVEKLEPFLRG